jgi:hypothetical protein
LTTLARRSERTFVTICATLIFALSAAQAQDKIPVKSLDDLPRHTYKLPGTATELLESDEQFAALAKAVRADVEGDLAKCQIEDIATLFRFRNLLLNLDLMEGRFDAVLKGVPVVRDLESKPAKKLTTGLVAEAYITARQKAGSDEAAFHAELRRGLLQEARALPWDVVGDDLKHRKVQMEMMTEPFLMGIVHSGIDPAVANSAGAIGADTAQQLVNLRFILKLMLPLRDDMVAAYGTVIEEHGVARKSIWPERAATLSPDQPLKPVTIGIWDSGVDTRLFEKQLWTDPDARPGAADAQHGIAYDVDFQPAPTLLMPLDGMKHDEAEMARHMKGFMDMQEAIDSPEAAAARKAMSELKEEDVKSFMEDLMHFGNYAHGTHVAGIAVEGDPFARILVARLTFDYHLIPRRPTPEYYRNAAAAYRKTVDYFKQHRVRVVNMSWGEDRATVERALEKNGVGATAAERAQMAREMFKVMRDGLRAALESAPDILFVVAAGNSDDEVEFAEMIPSGFDLPNVLVVGAVDQAGAPTTFTSFGRTVQVYACGFEVDSYIPGGQRMKLSGTSMAAPNVTNLAAKLLALDPSLTPARLIDHIKNGADEATSPKPMLLINPQRTLSLLRR